MSLPLESERKSVQITTARPEVSNPAHGSNWSAPERSWSTRIGGPVAIPASKRCSQMPSRRACRSSHVRTGAAPAAASVGIRPGVPARLRSSRGERGEARREKRCGRRSRIRRGPSPARPPRPDLPRRRRPTAGPAHRACRVPRPAGSQRKEGRVEPLEPEPLVGRRPLGVRQPVASPFVGGEVEREDAVRRLDGEHRMVPPMRAPAGERSWP